LEDALLSQRHRFIENDDLAVMLSLIGYFFVSI